VNRISNDPAHRRAANRAIQAALGSIEELVAGSAAILCCNAL
jgi:hypothetical protein